MTAATQNFLPFFLHIRTKLNLLMIKVIGSQEVIGRLCVTNSTMKAEVITLSFVLPKYDIL